MYAKNLVILFLTFAHDVKKENVGLRNIDPNLRRTGSL